MKTRLFAVLVALAVGQSASRAQTTVNYNAGIGTPNVVDSTGTPLPNSIGNTVEIGFFDTTGGFDFTANLGNLADLQSHWHQYDATTITTLVFEPGRFARTSPTQFSPLFDGMHIDLWIFKTSDLLAPAGNFSNVQEYGLFSGTGLNWSFPVQGTAPPGNSTTIQTDQINQFYVGGSIPGTPGSIQLAPVPEPTGLALLGLGLAAVLGRRLRR